MVMSQFYAEVEPARSEVDAQTGAQILEFGAPWCGHCRSVQPYLMQALEDHPEVSHVKIEDGPGRPLGRSFRVKLWPTLIFLRDGQEVDRLVRPTDASGIRQRLEKIAS